MDLSHSEGDPRITGEYVRKVPGGPGSLTIVGVVHDHPASVYRVRRAIGDLKPDILALELPPIAVPLFEQYAESERTPPTFGGEMSAAIQAAEVETTAGIDRPTGRFFRKLVRNLLRERPSPATVRKVLTNAVSVSKHAIVCRIASAIAARTSLRLEVDFPVAHGIDWSDAPEHQARDERRQIRQTQAFMNSVGGASTSRASRVEDATREEHMAERLSEHRRSGDVVAVVGIDHLDPLIERLSE